MQALLADPVVADAAKAPVVVRGLRAARTDPKFEARLASSCRDIKPIRLAGSRRIRDGRN